jgi:hypothetical protein
METMILSAVFCVAKNTIALATNQGYLFCRQENCYLLKSTYGFNKKI